MFGPTNRKFQGMETAVPPSALRTLCGVPGYPLKCSKSFSLPLPHGPTFFFIWNFYPFSFTSFAVGKREEESFHIFSPSSPQKRYISYFLDLSLHEVWCSSDVVENGACFSPTTVHWRFCWRVACNFPLPKKLVFFPPIFVPLWGEGWEGGYEYSAGGVWASKRLCQGYEESLLPVRVRFCSVWLHLLDLHMWRNAFRNFYILGVFWAYPKYWSTIPPSFGDGKDPTLLP